jgi:hypothetical protein
MFTNILVTVKPTDKHHRAYKRVISARLHRGFQMLWLPGRKGQVLEREQKNYQQLTQDTRLNIASGEDCFVGIH